MDNVINFQAVVNARRIAAELDARAVAERRRLATSAQ